MPTRYFAVCNLERRSGNACFAAVPLGNAAAQQAVLPPADGRSSRAYWTNEIDEWH